jgi:protein-tyrosine phosphatase
VIDIHSHILSEIDDGAATLDESLDMCRRSAADGITVMVATPHRHDGVHDTHEAAFLREKVEELNKLLDGVPRIELGCELRFTHEVVKQVCSDKSAPTIAGGPYLLVEFPHAVIPLGSERAFFELMSNDIRPIIAHPERNHMLIGEPERLFGLIEMGALGQADTGSFTGRFGKKVQETAEIMLENGLLHILASDCHNTRSRLPGMSAAVASVGELVGSDFAKAMADDNPGAVVRGDRIPVKPDAFSPKKRKKWLFF